MREKFLGEANLVTAQPVLAHQQPSGQSLVGVVQPVARRDLCRLYRHVLPKLRQTLSQRRTNRQNGNQVPGTDSVPAAGNLDNHPGGAGFESGHQRQPDKTFSAGKPDFHKLAVPEDREDRRQSVTQEVAISDRLRGLIQNRMQRQWYQFQFWGNGFEFLAGQSSQNSVSERGALGHLAPWRNYSGSQRKLARTGRREARASRPTVLGFTVQR